MIGKTDLLPGSVRFVSEGWYASAAYALTDWFILGLYYSEFTKDKLEGDRIDDMLREWVLTTRFDINTSWIIKFEYHLMKGLYFNTDGATDATHGDDYWHLYGAKVSFNF